MARVADYRMNRGSIVSKALAMLGDHFGEAYDAEHVADVLNDVVLDFCLKGRCCMGSVDLPGASSYGVYNVAGVVDQARAGGADDRCYGFAVRGMDG